MSLPKSSTLRSTHSRRGGHGGRPGGGFGRSLSGSVGTCHSPRLGKRSAGVASAATTQQGRGAGAVSPMAYSTPTQSLTFSEVLATSQEKSVSSLSQSQSTSTARRKGDARPLMGNIRSSQQDDIDGTARPVLLCPSS